MSTALHNKAIQIIDRTASAVRNYFSETIITTILFPLYHPRERSSFILTPCSHRYFPFAALPRTIVVHGEDFEKDFPVLFWVIRGGHQHAENGSADEDQRLTPLPFVEPGESLAGSRLTLLVRLSGEAGNGKPGFDERGHEYPLHLDNP